VTALLLASWLSTYFVTYHGVQPIPSPAPAEMIIVPLNTWSCSSRCPADPTWRA